MEINFQALMMMIVSGFTEPIQGIDETRMNLFNEAFVLFITYHLYQFTDFMTDLNARDLVGLSVIIVTVFNVLLNISVVAKQSGLFMFRKVQLKYLELKHGRAIALQQKLKQAASRYENRSLQQKAAERL